MAENPDYKELLQVLNRFEVRYLIVGGYAIMKYTEPRYTKDLDIWVESSAENALRVFRALKSFGAPLESDGITPATFARRDVIYQIGIAPVRVDILTQITGVEFTAAWHARVRSTVFGIPVHFLSLDHLLANKRATGRGSDAEQLEELSKKTESGK